MVVRIDPASELLALTSFPRDLMVTIADTGETGMINSAFARDTGGEQNLIDTLKQNFDITINHYVQVNFESFRQVVESIGGVPTWMPSAARRPGVGLLQRPARLRDVGRPAVRLRAQPEDGGHGRPGRLTATRCPTRTASGASRSSSSGP